MHIFIDGECSRPLTTLLCLNLYWNPERNNFTSILYWPRRLPTVGIFSAVKSVVLLRWLSWWSMQSDTATSTHLTTSCFWTSKQSFVIYVIFCSVSCSLPTKCLTFGLVRSKVILLHETIVSASGISLLVGQTNHI